MRYFKPAEALAAIAAAGPLPRYFLAVLDDRPGLGEVYARGGYRLEDAETLMVCDLAATPVPTPDRAVALVRADEECRLVQRQRPGGPALDHARQPGRPAQAPGACAGVC